MDDEWINHLLNQIKSKIEILMTEWGEMGIQKDFLLQRRSSTEKHLSALLDDMIREETLSKLEMKERILKLETQLHQMSNELELPVTLHKTSETLVIWEEKLAKEIAKFDDKRAERQKDLESIQEEEKILCKRLSEAAVVLIHPDRLIPCLSDIKLIKDHVAHLKSEKHRRLLRLVESQSQIVKHCLKLEFPEGDPDSEFCQQLLAKDALNHFSLSVNTLEMAVQMEQSLNERVSKIKHECDSIRQKLEILWDRLDSPECERAPFRDAVNAPPNTPTDLYILRCELDRLEEVKRVNMGRFIKSCREELHRWWDYCHLADSYRQFPGLLDKDYSEELLEEHEKEINVWKEYYARNEILLRGIEEWNSLFTQLMDAERKMKDPTILKNRGGILLKITNEKKHLNQQLLKLEKKIGIHLSEENEETIPVTFNGRTIADHISHCWTLLTDQKENEKKGRQDKANKLLEQECRFGALRADLKRKPGNFGSVMNLTAKPKDNTPSAKLRKMNRDNEVQQPTPSAIPLPKRDMNVSVFSSYSEFTRGIPQMPTSSRGRSSSTVDSGLSSTIQDKKGH